MCRWEGSVSDLLRMMRPRRKYRGQRLLTRLLEACSGTPEALRGEVYLVVLQVDPGQAGEVVNI